MEIFFLILGLLGLWIGAGRVVASGKALANRLGVSPLLIGLTIVSIGTSLPEIMVSIFSGVRGDADDLAVGAMIGSCLTQITFILGVAGMIHNIKVREKAIRVDGKMLLIAITIFFLALWTGMRITPLEGLLMILVYIGYLVYTTKHDELRKQAKELGKHRPKGFPVLLRVVEMVLGVAILLISAEWVTDNATRLAESNGLSQAFIGVLIVGAATGLPELSTAVTAAFRRVEGISIGVLIGSNITDPLFSMGLGALFGGFDANPIMLTFDIPYWFVYSAVALLLLYSGGTLTLDKKTGAALILLYVLFVTTKIIYF